MTSPATNRQFLVIRSNKTENRAKTTGERIRTKSSRIIV